MESHWGPSGYHHRAAKHVTTSPSTCTNTTTKQARRRGPSQSWHHSLEILVLKAGTTTPTRSVSSMMVPMKSKKTQSPPSPLLLAGPAYVAPLTPTEENQKGAQIGTDVAPRLEWVEKSRIARGASRAASNFSLPRPQFGIHGMLYPGPEEYRPTYGVRTDTE